MKISYCLSSNSTSDLFPVAQTVFALKQPRYSGESSFLNHQPEDNYLTIVFKGPAHSKNENLYFLVPAQNKRMQPNLVLCEALFVSNLQKNTGPVGVMPLTGPMFFF